MSSTVPLTLHPLSPWLLLSLSSPSQKPVSLAERQAPFPVFLSASPAHSSAAHTGSEPGRQGMRRGIRSEKAPAQSDKYTFFYLRQLGPTRQPTTTDCHGRCHPTSHLLTGFHGTVEDSGLARWRALLALTVARGQSESENELRKAKRLGMCRSVVLVFHEKHTKISFPCHSKDFHSLNDTYKI